MLYKVIVHQIIHYNCYIYPKTGCDSLRLHDVVHIFCINPSSSTSTIQYIHPEPNPPTTKVQASSASCKQTFLTMQKACTYTVHTVIVSTFVPGLTHKKPTDLLDQCHSIVLLRHCSAHYLVDSTIHNMGNANVNRILHITFVRSFTVVQSIYSISISGGNKKQIIINPWLFFGGNKPPSLSSWESR